MTIDTEKLDEEKELLKKLISPAIFHFIEETGFNPVISLVTIITNEQTGCGVISSMDTEIKIEVKL